eukprot:COSAG01_NODE_6101_length_3849_cov_17.876533_1_plen_77_part_00
MCAGRSRREFRQSENEDYYFYQDTFIWIEFFFKGGAFAPPSIVLKIKTMWHPLAATTHPHSGRGKGVTRKFCISPL